MNKKYYIPEDLHDEYVEMSALVEAKTAFINCIFGSYGKTLKIHKEAAKARRKFWDKVGKIYPELNGKTVRYLEDTREIIIQEGVE